jgi:6-phosphogluconolactonase
MRTPMGYESVPMAMTLEVYASDAEAFEAAAGLAAERLRAAGAHATVALAGGRSGRGVMVALAARGDLPWERVEWFWGDERCVPADDGRSNQRLARDSLLVPRGVAAGRIHPPPVALDDPSRIAAAYAATLAAEAPVFDLVLLGLGACGSVASLVPGAGALRAPTPVAAVAREEVAEEPRVARITVTPPVLAAARHLIVVAVGGEKAAAVAAAVADGADPAVVPAALVRPCERVTWIVDRAAASVLLRAAQPAQ